MNTRALTAWVSAAARGAVFACLLSAPSFAQDKQTDDGDLLVAQEVLFDQMFEEPDNLDLMFKYALISIDLRDYEAAISVLDRMLIFNPDLPRVRLELGAAYFRIGSYQFAQQYFQQVLDHPNITDDLRTRVGEFVDAINQRTRRNYITGIVQTAIIGTTNANNAPGSRNIEFLGFPARLIGDEATSQTDIGTMTNVQVTHVYDLGGPDGDAWRTNGVAYSQRFASTKSGAADVFVLRTGPQLSLEKDQFGLKARPFVEFDHVRLANDGLYTTIGAGLELRDTLNKDVTASGDLRVGWRDFHNGSGGDGLNIRGSAGFDYFYSEPTTISARALFEYEGAENRSERSYEAGLQTGIAHRYNSGLDISDRRWLVTATARGSVHFFDAPGQADPAQTRQDLDLRLALSNLAHISGGFSVLTKLDYLIRASNIRNFDLNSLSVTVGGQFSF